MKFFVLSDIHIDNMLYHIGDVHDANIQALNNYKRLIEKVPEYNERVWLLAGDISSYGKYTKNCYEILKELTSMFKHTFMVLGNHDYASNTTTEEAIIKHKEYAKEIHNLTLLDGDVIEYEGIKIGGCLGWYTMFDQLNMYVSELINWGEWYDGTYWNYLDQNPKKISKIETEKMKNVIEQKPDILILDEPTNHLDIETLS